jgi:hypothetical protein
MNDDDDTDLLADIQKLHDAVDAFAVAMKARLAEKAAQGFEGWDDPDLAETIEENLFDHVRRLLKGHRQEIDIANFAMMLWHQSPTEPCDVCGAQVDKRADACHHCG